MNATDEEINSVVEKKSGWIQTKKAMVQLVYPQTSEKEYVNGEGFWYLGKSYRLEIIEGANKPIELRNRFFLDRSVLPKAQIYFSNWYREQALKVIPERVAWYATNIGMSFHSVKITSAQKRWGSCSAKGTLSFPWRLVMAPIPVIDYVVVHELVHLSEKNHGKVYWAKLRAIMPDYKQKIEWLDKNGHLLRIS